MDAPSHDQFVIELGRIGAGTLPATGGKATNLGILMASGLPVPGGFCLTTAAYRAMAEAIGLEGPVEVVEQADAGDLAGLAEAAGHVREAILAAALPDQVARETRVAYASLGPQVRVAVRSSATAEDLAEASFAGQQDTFLNVSGADAVLEAVRQCWASLWTDRAVAYRAAHGIGQHTVSLAVVVQHMVPAQTAGVLFTANPVTGTRHQAVVDAAPGLGDVVVSGGLDPDHFVLDTASGRILQQTLGNRPGARQACLTAAQLRVLAALGAKAEDVFGFPQDLEWAADPDGTIWLTQSRSITTLYPVPEGRTPAEGERVYMCASLAQGLIRPFTPMGLAAIGGMRDERTGWRMAEAGLRPFVDLTPVLRSKGGRRTMLRMFRVAEARSAVLLEGLCEDPRFAVIAGSRSPSAFSGTGGKQFVLFLLRILEAAARPDAALRRVRGVGRKLEQQLELAEPATPVQRLDFVERTLSATFSTLVLDVLAAPAAGFAMLGLARWLLRGIAEPAELQVVLRGLPNNVTTEMDLQLWQLAVEVRKDPESAVVLGSESAPELSLRYRAGTLPKALQEQLAVFLARYGHRAVAEIDVGMPRWSEDPAHLLGVIANYLRAGEGQLAPDAQFARAAALAEAKVADLAARARRGPAGRLRAAAVGLGLRRARRLAGLREQPKFYIICAFAALRRQLSAVGEVLAGSGRIAAAEDIYFLSVDEAQVGLRGADLKELIAQRRRTYDRELQRRYVPRLLLSDGTDVEAAAAARRGAGPGTDTGGSLALSGSPASAGTVTGKARIILDPVGARLEPGEILVAPSTDPGWTPLFMTAGALVMEMGGTISHGAVVAREYGIPAVVGVPDATVRLRTGQRITVDGAAGTVTLAGPEE